MYLINLAKRKTRLPFSSSPLGRSIFFFIVISVIFYQLAQEVSSEATIFEQRVSVSSDDAEERASGSMKLTSSDLELVYDRTVQTVGMRFIAVTIPAGANIIDAYIQFQVDETNSETASLMIKGEAADNASTFSNSRGNISSRSRTGSYVQWNPASWVIKGEAGAAQRTPSIVSIIQEIVNRPGWSSGNSLVIIITGTGERVAESYNGDSSGAPLLHVEYSGGGNTFPTVSITAPADNANFPVDDPVIFTSAASDAEDGDLSDSLAWSSNLDGSIGTGNSFSTSTLSQGSHTITASVTDSGGLEGTDQITVTVGEVPATLDVRVAASTDDAEERASGNMKLTSSDLELVYDSSDQIVGMRFDAVTIPNGASIVRAYIQLQTDETSSGTTSLTIKGELTDDAVMFNSSSGNISTRNKTSNTVFWSPPAWTSIGEAGPDQQTPDIAPIILEIVEQPGWSSGNSLVIIITGTGERIAESFNGVPAAAPLLHVEHIGGEDKPVAPPEITSFTPTSGLAATGVEITGSNFIKVQDVAFNGISSIFMVASYDTIYATVPPGETTGPITVSTLTGNAISTTEFTLIPGSPVPPVLVGAGDIAKCQSQKNDEETANLLDAIAGTVFTLGDNAYSDGTLEEFNNCYEPSWGRHKHRTRPVPGNHDYNTPGAAGYFDYFGPAAGDPDKGYYSYDMGGWHIIALNSECKQVGGCDSDSPQAQWLQADLAQYTGACTLAYWHKSRFSSGYHGNNSAMSDYWQILYDAGAELVISGHDHDYERFAPQDVNGTLDTLQGIRQFVVGTGGKSLSPISETEIEPNSEVHSDDTYGVLKLTLHPDSYDWEFVPIAGQVFSDSGSEPCH